MPVSLPVLQSVPLRCAKWGRRLRLARALAAGQIAAAGLDVFEGEPKVIPELLALKNVVLAPHMASATEKTRRAMIQLAIKNCLAGLNGQTPPNLLKA